MDITDEQWKVVEAILPEDPVRDDGRGRPWSDRRKVLSGVLWILRTGAPWQDMPARYGPYQTAHRRCLLKLRIARSLLTPLSLTNRHGGMKDRIMLSAVIVALFLTTMAGTPAANMPLPRSTPEAQGTSSQAICDFVEALDKINTLHSFILVRHGNVIGEGWWKPQAPDIPHVLQ